MPKDSDLGKDLRDTIGSKYREGIGIKEQIK